MALTINSPAPDFEAQDQSSQTRHLKDFTGKWLLLYFYPADFTPGCTVEACSFRDAFSQLQQEVEIVGVSSDAVASHQRFSQTHSLPFLLLSDPTKRMITDYGANGVVFNKRVSFLINPEGIIAKIYDKVNVKKHADQVLRDITSLKRS